MNRSVVLVNRYTARCYPRQAFIWLTSASKTTLLYPPPLVNQEKPRPDRIRIIPSDRQMPDQPVQPYIIEGCLSDKWEVSIVFRPVEIPDLPEVQGPTWRYGESYPKLTSRAHSWEGAFAQDLWRLEINDALEFIVYARSRRGGPVEVSSISTAVRTVPEDTSLYPSRTLTSSDAMNQATIGRTALPSVRTQYVEKTATIRWTRTSQPLQSRRGRAAANHW